MSVALVAATLVLATIAVLPRHSSPPAHAKLVTDVTASIPTRSSPVDILTRKSVWVPTQDWSDRLRDPSFWASRRSGSSGVNISSPPSGLGRSNPLPYWPQRSVFSPLPGNRGNDGPGDSGTTHRTMCVRLCDGFFWPVSFATTSSNFERDAAVCTNSCGGATEARLFSYPNPGGSPDDMIDLDGKPYKKLPNAFAFRAKYDNACKCRPHPWEEASSDRHQSYALADQVKKGDRNAAQQLVELKGKLAKAAAVMAREKADRGRSRSDAAFKTGLMTEPQPGRRDGRKPGPNAVQKQVRERGDDISAVYPGRATSLGRPTSTGRHWASLVPPATDRASLLPTVTVIPARPQSRTIRLPAKSSTKPQGGTRDKTTEASNDSTTAPIPGLSAPEQGIVILRYGARAPVEIPVQRSKAR